MKPEYKPLKELNDKTLKYKTKGFTMKGALFDSDIEKYAEALERNGEYELSNAIISAVPPQHASKPNEYSIIINARAQISPLTTDATALGPQYQAFATIPRDPFSTELVDVLGVVIYVTAPKAIFRSQGIEDFVHFIYDRSFTVSLWNDVLRTHEETLNSWPDSFNVVGVLALTGRSYKGFTLSSTMSIRIITNPEGEKADALRAWATNHQNILTDHRSKLAEIHSSTTTTPVTKIEEINRKRASNTWQEERFNLRVTLPTASAENLRLYLGCSKCGRRTNETIDTTFRCTFCNVQSAKSEPRPILKVDAVDDSGSMALTFFAKEVEYLVGIPCTEMWKLKENDNDEVLAEKMFSLRQKNVNIEIGPTLALSTSRVLNWTVRS
ncbi:Replication protein A 70 kDa DNA-binding subunit B, partial [Bienertia sinuspersici]